MPQSQRSNEFGDVVSWFVSKFGAFLSNEMMRNIIGQTTSAFDLREIMDNKKILLVNLSKGRTGQLNMQLLGMIFVMKFQAAAMSRANVPESERQDFALYVDEFQNFSTDSFATILSEARKYHLNLIAANQFTTQLSEEIRDAVFGNVGTTVAFRVGDRDAEALRKYFLPMFEETDLIRMPSHNAAVRTMIHGVPTLPFSMATLPPLGSPNVRLAEALKQLSAAKYGRPKSIVEQEIFARMATKPEPPRPAFGTVGPTGGLPWASSPPPAIPPRPLSPPSPAAPRPVTAAVPAPPPAKSTSSFLEEWLAKRRSPVHPATVSPIAPVLHPAPSVPGGAKNISSGSLEQDEIDQLATRLRSSLDAVPQSFGAPSGAAQATDRPTPVPVRPASEAAHEPGTTTIDLSKPHPGDSTDTIFIDQEGVVHERQHPSQS